MENRKNDKANLEKLRYIFSGIGFVGIIGIVFLAFSFKTYDKVSYDFSVSIEEIQEELPPLIAPAVPPPPPPPPPKQKPPPKEPEIEIVKDDVEVEEEEFDDEDEEEMEIEETEEGDEEPAEELDKGPVVWVQDMPHYKECANEKGPMRDMCTKKVINKKIREAFVLPDIAQDMGLKGIVYVSFVVGRDGKVKDVKILKGVHKYLDDAAIKAVQKLPTLIPGKQLDKAVEVLYQVPVRIQYN